MVHLRYVAHYGHKNLVLGCSEWKDKRECRKFDTIEEHDDLIVNNFNKYVKLNDVMYHCGDWSFGGREKIYEFRKRLNCKFIHLIGGNHDELIRRNAVIPTEKGFINAHNLFTSYSEILDKKVGGQNIVFCHYAMRTWHKASRGSWNLYGHSHGNLEDYYTTISTPIMVGSTQGFEQEYKLYKSMDVGLDTHPEFRPYHIEEVRDFMKDKIDLGHHERKEQ